MNESNQSILRRSHSEAFIVRCNIKSPLAENLFKEDASYGSRKVKILQVMPVTGEWLLVELI